MEDLQRGQHLPRRPRGAPGHHVRQRSGPPRKAARTASAPPSSSRRRSPPASPFCGSSTRSPTTGRPSAASSSGATLPAPEEQSSPRPSTTPSSGPAPTAPASSGSPRRPKATRRSARWSRPRRTNLRPTWSGACAPTSRTFARRRSRCGAATRTCSVLLLFGRRCAASTPAACTPARSWPGAARRRRARRCWRVSRTPARATRPACPTWPR
jgi:hypothetical protein